MFPSSLNLNIHNRWIAHCVTGRSVGTIQPPLPPIDIAPTSQSRGFQLGPPSTWPKWAVALLIGIPLAAVAAYYFYSQDKPRKPVPGSRYQPPDRTTGKQYPKTVGDVPSSTGVLDDKAALRSEPVTIPEKISALKNQGNQMFRAKKYSEAKKSYTEAIDLAVKNHVEDDLAQSLQNRAACSEQLKEFDKVIADCTAALEIDKKYSKAYARRSRAYEKDGNFLSALEDAVAASILTKFQTAEYREKSVKLTEQLARKLAIEEISKRSSLKTVKLSKVFVRQFFMGFIRDPVRILMNRGKSQYPSGHFGAALEALKENQYELAVSECTKAISSTDEEAENIRLARLLRGTMNFIFGKIKESTEDLEAVLNDTNASLKEKSNAQIKLACIKLHQQVDPRQILAQLDNAIKLDPDNPDIYFHRAQIHMLFGNLEACLSDYKRCVEIQPNSDQAAAFHIAHLEYRQHSMENPMDQMRALQIFENKIVKDIQTSDAFVILAQIYMEIQNFNQAEIYLKRAMKPDDDPHNAVVYTQLAFLECLARENRQVASELAHKALQADGNYSPAIELLMDIDLQKFELDKARVLYQKCLDLAKNEAEMFPIIQGFQLAEVSYRMHQQLGMQPAAFPASEGEF